MLSVALPHLPRERQPAPSFMVAVQSAERAVGLALAIQTRLFEHEWGTADIDDTYRAHVSGALKKFQQFLCVGNNKKAEVN